MACGGPFLSEPILVEAEVRIDWLTNAIEYHPVIDLGDDAC